MRAVVTVARELATAAPDRIAKRQRDARQVGQLPSEPATPIRPEDGAERAPDQAAVPDQTGAAEQRSEEVVLDGVPVLDEVVDARTDQPADHHREDELPGPVDVLAELPEAATDDAGGDEKAQREADPEGLDRQRAEMYFRLHSEVVQRICHGSVDSDLEMQMRAKAETGASGDPDDLSLRHVLADMDTQRRLVPVARREHRGVLDAGVVAVARDPAGDRDAAGVGGADRRPGRHADVDAGVARLPGATLAEGRRDRPVDRPDHRAAAAPDRAGVERRATLGGTQLRLDLRLQLREVALELLARRLDVRERGAAPIARALELDAVRHELALHRDDLVAARFDRYGGGLLLAPQLAELLRLLGRERLERAHARDDLVVLVGDPVEELGPLEQVCKAVRLEHDGQGIGLAVLVHLDEALRQRLLGPAQIDLQPRQPVLRLLEPVLRREQLGALGVE